MTMKVTFDGRDYQGYQPYPPTSTAMPAIGADAGVSPKPGQRLSWRTVGVWQSIRRRHQAIVHRSVVFMDITWPATRHRHRAQHLRKRM